MKKCPRCRKSFVGPKHKKYCTTCSNIRHRNLMKKRHRLNHKKHGQRKDYKPSPVTSPKFANEHYDYEVSTVPVCEPYSG
jgi:hypothetical protein